MDGLSLLSLAQSLHRLEVDKDTIEAAEIRSITQSERFAGPGKPYSPPQPASLVPAHGLRGHSPIQATVRQNAASPPRNFQGKHPTMQRRFCSSGASISPPTFS